METGHDKNVLRRFSVLGKEKNLLRYLNCELVARNHAKGGQSGIEK